MYSFVLDLTQVLSSCPFCGDIAHFTMGLILPVEGSTLLSDLKRPKFT